MQKIKKSILFLLIGAMSMFCIEVFIDKDTSTTSLPKALDDSHESRIDQRINDHLDQLTRKVQLQKLRAKSVTKEMEFLKISSPRLRYSQLDTDQQGSSNKNLGAKRHQSLTHRIDARINNIELEARRQALRQQEEEEDKRERIKLIRRKLKRQVLRW